MLTGCTRQLAGDVVVPSQCQDIADLDHIRGIDTQNSESSCSRSDLGDRGFLDPGIGDRHA